MVGPPDALRPASAMPASRSGTNRLWLLAAERGRFLVDGVDGGLADAAFHVLLDRRQRLAPLGFFLVVQSVDLGLAGSLDRRHGLVVFLLGDGVGILGGILHRALQL